MHMCNVCELMKANVTWYGKNYAGTQITWDIQNKGKSGWTGNSSVVMKVPLCYLHPSIVYSVLSGFSNLAGTWHKSPATSSICAGYFS